MILNIQKMFKFKPDYNSWKIGNTQTEADLCGSSEYTDFEDPHSNQKTNTCLIEEFDEFWTQDDPDIKKYKSAA